MTTIYDRNELSEDLSRPIFTISLNPNKEKYKNISKIMYKKGCVIKNNICPIILNKFIENRSFIRIFPKCFHALSDEVFYDFIIYFSKCPLCRTPL